jgi:hypothetical protein
VPLRLIFEHFDTYLSRKRTCFAGVPYCLAGDILSGDFSDNSIFIFANIAVGNCKERQKLEDFINDF